MQGSDLKTFVGAQDYETSKDFYTAMGFAWVLPRFRGHIQKGPY